MNELLGATGPTACKPHKDNLNGHWQKAKGDDTEYDAAGKDGAEIKNG